MPVPNPLWGIHVTPGAITGALVLRTENGEFEVLSTVVEDAPQPEAPLLAAALQFLERKDVRGRAAHLALPDDEGSFVAVQLTQEEQFLDDQELVHELFERTPFDPSEGTLVFRRRGDGAGRDLLVAAMPRSTLARRADVLAGLDRAYHGVGLTGPAFARGAQALGLTGERTLLVDVQPELTMLTALVGGDVRRYMLPSGRTRLQRDAEPLARDLLRVARYHADQERGGANGGEIDDADLPTTVFVGPGARAAAAALAPHLEGRLATTGQSKATVMKRGGAGIDAAQAGAIAAAVGAALEAHAPATQRMALRPPPDDVPEYVAPGGGKKWLLVAAAGGIAAIAIAASQLGGGENGDDVGKGDGEKTAAVTNGGNGAGTTDLDPPEVVDAAAVRAVLEEATSRRALTEALLAARSLAATAPPGSADSIRVDRSGADYTLTLTLSGTLEVLAPVERAMQRAADARPGVVDLQVLHRADGGLVATARAVAEPPPGASALETDGVPHERTERSPLAALWQVRGAAVRDSRQIELTVPHAESSAAVREAVRAAAPPGSLLLERGVDGVLARAETGERAGWPRLLPLAAIAFLRTADEDVEQALGALGDGPVLGARPAAPSSPPRLIAAAAGSVRLRLPAGSGSLLLERAGPGEERFAAVAEGAAGTEIVDHVPGSSGDYRYRASVAGGPAGPEETVAVVIPVDVLLLAADPDAGTARLRLTRAWRGDPVSAEVDVAPGDTVAATTARDGLELSLTTRFSVTAIENVLREEGVTVDVPGFNPDGRVLRGPDGRPATHATQWSRTVPVATVRAVDGGGRTAVWSALEK